MKTILTILSVFSFSQAVFADTVVEITQCHETYTFLANRGYQAELISDQFVINASELAVAHYSKSHHSPKVVETSKANSGEEVYAQIRMCDDKDMGQANCETYYYKKTIKTTGAAVSFVSELKAIYSDPHCCGPITVRCVED